MYAAVHVIIVDTVQSNGTLLRMWAESEAEGLGVACSVEMQTAQDCTETGAGLLFVSAERIASANLSLPVCLVVQAPAIVCVYGVAAETCVQADLMADARRCFPGAQLYVTPWPVSRRSVRRLLAETAVMCSPLAASRDSEGDPFGNPVPNELAELVSKLKSCVCELVTLCEKALAGGSYVEGCKQAHTLKGAAMSFGQSVLAEVAGALQEAFEAGSTEPIRYWLGVMRRIVDR